MKKVHNLNGKYSVLFSSVMTAKPGVEVVEVVVVEVVVVVLMVVVIITENFLNI